MLCLGEDATWRIATIFRKSQLMSHCANLRSCWIAARGERPHQSLRRLQSRSATNTVVSRFTQSVQVQVESLEYRGRRTLMLCRPHRLALATWYRFA